MWTNMKEDCSCLYLVLAYSGSCSESTSIITTCSVNVLEEWFYTRQPLQIVSESEYLE